MLSKIFTKMGDHKLLTQAAALAFYTTLSLGPLLMIFFLLLSLTQLDIQIQFINQVANLFGSGTADLMQTMLDSFGENAPTLNSFAGLIAVITLLISASAVFGQLRESLNIIISEEVSISHFNSAEEMSIRKAESSIQTVKSFVAEKMFGIGMVLTFIFLSATSLILSSFLSATVKLDQSSPFYLILNGFISWAIFSLIFYLIFFYMPACKPHKKPTLIGAVATGFLFVFGKELIGQLASSTLMASSYGAGGSLVILMAWFYYASVIVFLGAEVTTYYDQKI